MKYANFFFKSWVFGYKNLGWNIKREKNDFISQNIPVPSITQFELWATKFENYIRVYITNDFRESSIDISKPIEFDVFCKWIHQDHNLYITYAHKQLCVATSLGCLDDIGFEESQLTQKDTNFLSYPSFSK